MGLPFRAGKMGGEPMFLSLLRRFSDPDMELVEILCIAICPLAVGRVPSIKIFQHGQPHAVHINSIS
jgi:hypothetical protein